MIAASIMSKKIAGGADRIVLDVKVGPGGFLPEIEQARTLARMMVAIGREFGRGVVAVLTSMQQPLGLAIGNALEARGGGDSGGQGSGRLHRTVPATGCPDPRGGGGRCRCGSWLSTILANRLRQGAGLAKLREIIAAQGGLADVVDDPGLLPRSTNLVRYGPPIAAMCRPLRPMSWAGWRCS